MAETIKGFGDRSTRNTTMAAAPEAPDDVVAVMVPNISDQLKVTWTQPKPYGKCTITSNKVTWIWQDYGENKVNETVISNTSNYTISGLKPYTNYTVCVAVKTEGGYGPSGECSSAVTEEDVPGPPIVTVTEPSLDSIHLMWEHPVEPRGELLFYNLSWMNTADISDSGNEKIPANQTSYTITGLQSNSQYNISLMAKTSAGWGTVLAETHETIKPTTTTPEPLWMLVFAVAAVLAVMGLLVYRQRRMFPGDSGILPNIDDIQESSTSIYKTKNCFQNESYIYDGGDVEEITENEYSSFDEQGTKDGTENYISESPELSANPKCTVSPKTIFNENGKGEKKHTTEFSSDGKFVEDMLPFQNIAKRTENNSVPVNHKVESTDSNPEKLSSRGVFTWNGSLVQDVIEDTDSRESVLDLKNMGEIHEAARGGRGGDVLRSLEDGEDPSASAGSNNTPLHYAAYEGHTDVLRVLLDKKSDPNLTNDTGDTPLHLAAINGKVGVVKMFSEEEGVNLNQPSATNQTLLAYARYGREKPMLDVLRNPETVSPEGNTPLHCASLAGHTEVVKLLLMKKADVKSETPTHHTPLHYAALAGNPILIKQLVSYGADPNAKDERNNTPLHYAALCGHTLVVEMLVDDRADIHVRTDMGLSVLHKASFYGRLSTVQKLVELQDTLVNTRDKENLSAEDTALIRGHVHTAWWLNKNATETSLQDQKHLTNICMSRYKQSGDFYHTYCRQKNASAKALATAIDFGVCDMHYQDEQGRTLLHVAAEQNDRPKIRVLLERGALPTARTHDGKTPSDLAREKGHLQAAKTIADKIRVEEMGHKKNMLYTHLLNQITALAKANLQGDNEEQEARLAAVKEASSLLASGAPLEPPGGHSCYPLHHAITANCTSLLPLLLAAGAPLTSSADSFGPVQMAWMTPDATPWVGVVVTRVSLARECRRLADESEKAREPIQKEEAKKFAVLLLSLYCAYYSLTDIDHDMPCWKTIFGRLNDELSEGDDDWMAKLFRVIRKQNTRDCEDKGSVSSFSNDTYSDLLDQIAERPSKYVASSIPLGNSENIHIQGNTFTEILEKATIQCCEKEFPLFLHLLVHVGGQKVNQELEVCRASPLHYAARKNNASAARYLVSHGASVEAKDRFGNTPAHYACMYGHKDLGDFLRTYKVNIYGLTAMDILDGYRKYLELYELDLKSLENIDMQRTNTGPQRIKILLKEFKKKWQLYGIGKTIAKVHINYSRGESQEIETAVLNFVDSLKNSVAMKNPMFSGEVVMLGSSADNVRLFCPDEFDCNIVLNSFNEGLQVSLEEMGPNYSGCRTKINVSSNDKNIISLLKGNRFLHTFYDLVKECISDIDPEDKRMTIIPPGVKRTKVGVGLSLAWTGREYPLLLVDVDIVPTMEAPWPADLPRPPLTPPHLKSVYINSIGNGEWRFSFAKAENEIMKNLTPDQRLVFLACKMVLSSLKVEKWASRDIQNRFKYFDKIFFKISSPKSFILKNTFFLELQDFKDQRYYWTDHLEKRIRSVFERMCEKDIKGPVKIEAYFAGGTEPSSLGYGAPDIVSFFTPKPGFHGVSEY
ncbi:serine/threonine-protein phosphatase 6 regulatory ankyrin repeat subunit A-like [Penaeus indicus]|uniref:serine/threonine-protein phosphatase 6 regulatory ankyrin repeat subunit A-like n=1 Tax=Penaeus indicus TaxID=29960 RepID=UPI00300C1312